MREPLRIFIGVDSREYVAWHVLAHSIYSRASCSVAILPLVQSALRAEGTYTRERGPLESTDFSMTRFLCPFLSGYWGTSIFLDSDMLCRVDIMDLMAAVGRAETEAMKAGKPMPFLYCCQHDYTPQESTKFLGNVQTKYLRKNWSSLMVFRNAECRALSPGYVNSATGLELHRFTWLPDERIGSLPLEWNYLVGETGQSEKAPRILHWTCGGPWVPEYVETDYADEWRAERDAMLGLAAAKSLAA
jgi:hypothetical protein